MSELRERTVLVTGAASGIGRELARLCAGRGAIIVAVDRNESALAALVEELRATSARVHSFVADLARRDAIADLHARTLHEVGPIDVLVNNAGVVSAGDYDQVSDESDRLMIAVNVEAVHWMTKTFLRDLKAQGRGHIVQLASAAGLMGVPKETVYSASKWFVVGLSESLRLELRQAGLHDIHVTIVCPSFVATGLFDGAVPPRFTPMLSPRAIAEKILRGIERDELYVKEPFMVRVTPVLRALLPTRMFDRIADRAGVTRAMDGWRGRAT